MRRISLLLVLLVAALSVQATPGASPCDRSGDGGQLRRRGPVDAANPGRPELISYEAFEIGWTGARRSLGPAVREYRPGVNVLTESRPAQSTRKILSLGRGLVLFTDVYRKPELSGFGLVLEKEGSCCFSWEWFDRKTDDVFVKRQGGGSVRVDVVEHEGVTELAAIEFLGDITLRCENGSDWKTHEVLIKKQSVFKVRP